MIDDAKKNLKDLDKTWQEQQNTEVQKFIHSLEQKFIERTTVVITDSNTKASQLLEELQKRIDSIKGEMKVHITALIQEIYNQAVVTLGAEDAAKHATVFILGSFADEASVKEQVQELTE